MGWAGSQPRWNQCVDLSLADPTALNPGESSTELKGLMKLLRAGGTQSHLCTFPAHSRGMLRGAGVRGSLQNHLLSIRSRSPSLLGSAGGMESEPKVLLQAPHSCCPLTLPRPPVGLGGWDNPSQHRQGCSAALTAVTPRAAGEGGQRRGSRAELMPGARLLDFVPPMSRREGAARAAPGTH